MLIPYVFTEYFFIKKERRYDMLTVIEIMVGLNLFKKNYFSNSKISYLNEDTCCSKKKIFF